MFDMTFEEAMKYLFSDIGNNYVQGENFMKEYYLNVDEYGDVRLSSITRGTNESVSITKGLMNQKYRIITDLSIEGVTNRGKETNDTTPTINKLEISTPKGKLIVESKGSMNEYPGIYVSFLSTYKTDDNPIIAVVEYDTLKNQIQTVTYNLNEDEPTNVIVHN